MAIIDLHCDTVSRALDEGLKRNDRRLAFRSFDFLDQTQVFALFVDDQYRGEAAEKRTESLYRFYLSGFKSSKNFKALLSIENAAALGGKIENVKKWADRGCKMMTLTWNGENELSYGADCDEGGLKPFGKNVIGEMERHRIAVDLSHINEKSFAAVLDTVSRPFILSHSCCYSVKEHRRNVKDWQLKELIACGGIIGLCFYPEFLGDDVFEKLYENIAHIADLGGEKSICLGSDFDGAKMDRKLSSTLDLPRLYDYLNKRGLSQSLLQGIFYKNAGNFFKGFYN
ncbi:MAG: dipeptidase [Acutalibacteraceae bacterium]